MSADRTLLETDYAVIGLGAMGASTLHSLARAGEKVVGIDAHSPPHSHGASHGGYKVTREAVAEGPAYLHFVRRTNEMLDDLEGRYGTSLRGRTGLLIIGSQAEAGSSSFLCDTVEIAETNRIEHQALSSGDLRKRYPQLVGLADRDAGYFEPNAGFIRPEPLSKLQIALARQAGAEVLQNTAVYDHTDPGRRGNRRGRGADPCWAGCRRGWPVGESTPWRALRQSAVREPATHLHVHGTRHRRLSTGAVSHTHVVPPTCRG